MNVENKIEDLNFECESMENIYFDVNNGIPSVIIDVNNDSIRVDFPKKFLKIEPSELVEFFTEFFNETRAVIIDELKETLENYKFNISL